MKKQRLTIKKKVNANKAMANKENPILNANDTTKQIRTHINRT